MLPALNDGLVKGYIRAIDVHMSERMSPVRDRSWPRVSRALRYLFLRSIRRGRPSRAMALLQLCCCRLFRRTKLSHYVRRDSRQFKLAACCQLTWCRNFPGKELLRSGNTLAERLFAPAMLSSASMIICWSHKSR